jgi:hypothetical protein
MRSRRLAAAVAAVLFVAVAGVACGGNDSGVMEGNDSVTTTTAR